MVRKDSAAAPASCWIKESYFGMNSITRSCLISLWGLTLLQTGCATLSSRIPIRPAPVREFPPPPAAVIRVPVILSLPVNSLAGDSSLPSLTWDIKKDIPNLVQFTKGAALKAWQDPLHLEASKNTLSTLMRIHYRLGGDAFGLTVKGAQQVKGFLGGLGPTKETVVQMQSALQWNKAWHMESLHTLEPLNSLGQTVTNASQQVEGLVRKAGEDFLLKGTGQFDERLKIVTDIEPRAKEVWAQIQEPIFLDKGIWFLLQPRSMSVGQIHLNPLRPQTVETVFQMTAYPEILFGPKPSTQKSSLPPLSRFEEGPGGFYAVSNLLISYPEAGQLIRDLHTGIIGHVFKETGDRKLKITGLRFYGSGGKVVVEVELQYNPIVNLSDKPAEMTAYLVGTLHYFPKSRMFELPDLDFDVKTGDLLVQVAEWIFKSDIRNLLRQKARIPVGPKLDDLKQKLSDALNRPLGDRLHLATQVNSFRVMEAFADNEGMKARVALDGEAHLNVDWR
jgi:hypothetical protein